MGVSKHTIYAWRQKYGGVDVSEAQELKQLRDENARLKKLVAEYALDREALKLVISKTAQLVGAKARLGAARVEHLRVAFPMSERHACGLLGLAVSSCRYRSRTQKGGR